MGLLVFYFDKINKIVKTRFYESRFLWYTTCKDLKEHLNNVIHELDGDQLFQLDRNHRLPDEVSYLFFK